MGNPFDIRSLSALEVLDSRGRPTVAVSITLGDGSVGAAGVPSGASTGTREAVELRDGDPTRFSGAGVLQAVGHVNGEIAELLQGRSWSSLSEVDAAMIELDGTPNKARLGANAIVGVSMALARALAVSAGKPLHAWLPGFGAPARLPVPELQRAQRRRARAERSGLPGVHDLSARCAVARRGGACRARRCTRR